MAFLSKSIRKILRYFTGNHIPDVDLTCDTKQNEKSTANEEEPTSDNACSLEKGFITILNEHFGLIDGQYFFENSAFTRFEEGMFVYYLAYEQAGQRRIKRLLSEVSTESDDSNLESSRIQIVGKVSARQGRLVCVEPHKFEFDLNTIRSEFIPIVGDWLDIEGIIEEEESEEGNDNDTDKNTVFIIEKIAPLKSEEITGIIEFFDLTTNIGRINEDIMFDKNVSCIPGYVPIIGDVVVAHVIESEQDDCIWRALKVSPSEKTRNRQIKIQKTDLKIDANGVNFGYIVHGIKVDKHIQIALSTIGDERLLKVAVRNTSHMTHAIVQVQFRAKESQLCLAVPSSMFDRPVLSQKYVIIRMLCSAKFMGKTNELVVIDFGSFKIGRWIKIFVGQDAKKYDEYMKNTYKPREKNLTKAARDSFDNMDRRLVVGQRPVKPPAFITNKLPMFEIPEHIAKIFFNEMDKNEFVGNVEIKKLAPCLEENVDAKNYKDKFHTLLYLEELAMQVNARRYDIDNAIFEEIDGFLKLEVHNLSERRPAIIVGDKVIALNSVDPERFEGFVHKTGFRHLYLKFNQQFHNAYGGEEFSVEIHSSRTNFRRYHHAVNVAMENLTSDFLFPVSVPQREPQVLFVEEESYWVPKPNILGTDTDGYAANTNCQFLKSPPEKQINFETDEKYPNYNPKYKQNPRKFNKNLCPSSKTASKVLKWFDKSLNRLQKLAVRNILIGEARPLPYLLYGPPGTGKTVTLIETILQIHTLIPNSRMLVVGPSNSAADLIALRLLDSGQLTPGDLVRLVAFRCVIDHSIPERLVPYCMTGDLAREGSRESKEHVQNGIRVCVRASDIGKHRIIVATCMIVGVLYTMGFPAGHFTHFIIDEAGQATEPETMIPLSLLDVRSAQTILAGDPLQLGPCVFSLLSKQHGLGDSFFERMINRFPYVRDTIGFPDTGGYDPRLVTRLIYNYRSVPEILELLNLLFYNSELRPMISDTHGAQVDLLKRLRSILPKRNSYRHDVYGDRRRYDVNENLPPSVVFHGVRAQNYQTADSPSWFNPSEAGQVVYYVEALYNVGLRPDDIGVITPYIKQGHSVRELMEKSNLPLPKIGSVEEFQGQEFKVVVLSAVRSNERGAKNDSRYGLGFIASPRRLNVALSRAETLLIIIGNPHLLITDNYWRSVLLYAVDNGGYRGCELPNFQSNTQE